MGQDLILRVEQQPAIFPADYDDDVYDRFNKHGLSRTFCNFMDRQYFDKDVDPELDQIGRITSVDISPFYEMVNYIDEDYERELLQMYETGEEQQDMMSRAKETRDKCKGNIDRVLSTVNALIDKLSKIDDLPRLLNDLGWDTIGYARYFTGFNIDKGKAVGDYNFGQDLRNFKDFLEYAKDKGAETVYFLRIY